MAEFQALRKAQLIALIQKERARHQKEIQQARTFAKQREETLEARIAELEEQTPEWLEEVKESLSFMRTYLRDTEQEMQSLPFLHPRREAHSRALAHVTIERTSDQQLQK